MPVNDVCHSKANPAKTLAVSQAAAYSLATPHPKVVSRFSQRPIFVAVSPWRMRRSKPGCVHGTDETTSRCQPGPGNGYPTGDSWFNEFAQPRDFSRRDGV